MDLNIIHEKVHQVRGLKIILDYDLALLYEVETKDLTRTVKKNRERFPSRFMFRLRKREWEFIHESVANTTNKVPDVRYPNTPFAFTEFGVTMLASVLTSRKAIHMSITIVESFIKLKECSLNYKELSAQIKKIETDFSKNFDDSFETINYLLKRDGSSKPEKTRRKMGYKRNRK